MPNEKTSIPCAVCRDLAPLVADGVASAESEALVRAHLEVCPACAAEWPELCAEGERPDQADVPETVPLPDDIRVLRRLHRKLNRRSALLLTAGALGWLSWGSLAVPAPQAAREKAIDMAKSIEKSFFINDVSFLLFGTKGYVCFPWMI